ncbi:UNVERIFIED_CONTAM: hypothetical protein FKN15_016627 [Acipenser sinensis]
MKVEPERQEPKRGKLKSGRWDGYHRLVEASSWCPSCGKGGHSVVNCPRPGEEEEGRPKGSWEAYLSALEAMNWCTACGEWGHFVVNCPILQEEDKNLQLPVLLGGVYRGEYGERARARVFSAEVSRGSSVTFSWVIDDLTVFAYTGQTYNVVFKKPAQYKLKVTAWNPVSSESLLVQLTADLMNPLADPHFLSVAKVMPVNTLQEIIFRVKVDISIDVTLRDRWAVTSGLEEADDQDMVLPSDDAESDIPITQLPLSSELMPLMQ